MMEKESLCSDRTKTKPNQLQFEGSLFGKRQIALST